MNDIEINNQVLAEQLKALKENKPVKEVKIIPIDVNYGNDSQKNGYKLRGEKYFIACENEPTEPVTSIYPDLTWLRKCDGLDGIDIEKHKKHESSPTSPITHESLNSGRIQEIEHLIGAIELGVMADELYNFQEDGTWGTYTTLDRNGKQVQRKHIPKRLTFVVKKLYKANIAKGLHVLCMYVGEAR